MKNKAHPFLACSGLVLALSALTFLPAMAEPMEAGGHSPMADKSSAHHEGMEGRGGMMKEHQAMMQEMKKQDAELTAQVAKMNSESGEKKVDLLAAIITTMVEERAVMHDHMEKMQGMMMMMPDSMPPGNMMNGADKPDAKDDK